jgi:O-acetyl-ADP-ribose deacetylase (regulator of RNase III)
MSSGESAPDPAWIATLEDLARELGKLRRRAAQPGQMQLSVRDVAARVGKAASTLDPYLRGQRLPPADVYEEMLRALGVQNMQLRPWLDTWERLAEAEVSRRAALEPAGRSGRPAATRRPQPLRYTDVLLYELATPVKPTATARVGIVTGDLRRVRCAEVWVNPENTSMRMPRYEEHSVSAVIRFEGAVRDQSGRVVNDYIADELTRKVAGRVPVAPGTAIATGAGELAHNNGVRYIIHVAAVHGEPGEGYRQILDIGRCVTNALAELARLNDEQPTPDARLRTILFPLLGTGVGGGGLAPTVTALLGATLDELAAGERGRAVETVYFLAYTDVEFDVCREIFETSSRLVGPVTPVP